MKELDIWDEAYRRCAQPYQDAFVQGAKWALGQEKKIIDLSKVAEKPIPMEVSNRPGKGWNTAFLSRIDKHSYFDSYGCPWLCCRFDLEAHPVAWFGGECPLPKGVLVDCWLRDGEKIDIHIPQHMEWGRSELWPDTDIIAFKVTGLQEGYVYPWET